ncbi:hypothetical protein AALA17_05815 [Lactobacillaceae bacterium 24-114]
MATHKFLKNVSVGAAAITLMITMAACGNQSASSTQSSSSGSSAQSSSSSSTSSAVKTANRQIENEDFQGAYDNLNKSNDSSTEAANLKTDLQNYLAAKKAYNNGSYDEATSNLKTQKSSSSAMKTAYSNLQAKISKKQATSSSNSSTSSSSQKVANQTASDATSDSVVTAFATKMGFTGSGYSIIPTSVNGNLYQLEVRQNNSDNTVSNMVGIYQYNSQTGAVTKID